MNQMIEALQGIMNQANGETISIPHPVDVKNVKAVPQTEWHYSVLKTDSYKDDEGDRHFNVVSARLILNTHLDDYNEPLGEPRLMLEHKYSHPTRQSKDVSVTAVKPNEVRALKERFPGAFSEYEVVLLRKGEDLPLALLDSVPPEVLQVAHTMGARKIADLAAFDEEKIALLSAKLEAAKLNARVPYIRDYIARARERAPAPMKRGKAA